MLHKWLSLAGQALQGLPPPVRKAPTTICSRTSKQGPAPSTGASWLSVRALPVCCALSSPSPPRRAHGPSPRRAPMASPSRCAGTGTAPRPVSRVVANALIAAGFDRGAVLACLVCPHGAVPAALVRASSTVHGASCSTLARTHVHPLALGYAHEKAHAFTVAHTHTRARTHTHTHTRTHTCTHTTPGPQREGQQARGRDQGAAGGPLAADPDGRRLPRRGQPVPRRDPGQRDRQEADRKPLRRRHRPAHRGAGPGGVMAMVPPGCAIPPMRDCLPRRRGRAAARGRSRRGGARLARGCGEAERGGRLESVQGQLHALLERRCSSRLARARGCH